MRTRVGVVTLSSRCHRRIAAGQRGQVGLTTRRLQPMGEPARGYSWPPFEPGNVAALTHGAWSPRKVDPLAREILVATAQHVDWWTPADQTSAWAWARAEARVQLVTEWLADHGGTLDDDGTVKPAAELLLRLERTAQSLRSVLGLDPLSRARLGRDVASARVDLARLWAAEDAADATEDG